jgi:signal transduction histidine kinase
MLDDAITQARATARGLFPAELGGDGLAQALDELAARVRRQPGLECRFEHPAPVCLARHTAAQLYRIALEAVNNAVKHADCKNITLRLAARDHLVELAVFDDGAGIAPETLPATAGMGLDIMSYRAEAIGAALHIRRRPEGGTAISCTVRTAENNLVEQP